MILILAITDITVNGEKFTLQESTVEISVLHNFFTMGNVPEEEKRPRIDISIPRTRAASKLRLSPGETVQIVLNTKEVGEITGKLLYAGTKMVCRPDSLICMYEQFGGVLTEHNVEYEFLML